MKRTIRISKVILKLQGGVGNQLFQLAAGIYHANKYEKELIVDSSLISRSRHNGSTIENLNIFKHVHLDKGHVQRIEFRGIETPKPDSTVSKAVSKFHEYLKISLEQKSQVGFDPRLEEFRKLRLIKGYFQCHQYFDQLISTEQIRRKDFLTEDLSKNSLKILNYIVEKNPIILHVRAGDYLKLSESIGVLTKTYFETAINLFPCFQNRKVLLLTDSPGYASSILKFRQNEIKFFEESVNAHPLEIISVLSFANDFIISNSTFSWWGAKLSTQRGHIIAPVPWFKGRNQPIGLIPQHWNQTQSSFL